MPLIPMHKITEEQERQEFDRYWKNKTRKYIFMSRLSLRNLVRIITFGIQIALGIFLINVGTRGLMAGWGALWYVPDVLGLFIILVTVTNIRSFLKWW